MNHQVPMLARRALTLLATVLTLGFVLLGAGPASALDSVGPQNAVGPHASSIQASVGLSGDVSAGQGRVPTTTYAQIVVATGVAANTAARACSFTGATLVLMADGSKKPIEDVEVGDEVIATDPETGEQEAQEVTHVFVHQDKVADLELEDGTVLGTTEDHPFWSVTDNRFERADELGASEQVMTADGRTLTVGGLRYTTSRTALAYNLSIDGIHTYHVGASAVLVHNTCPIPIYRTPKAANAADELAGGPNPANHPSVDGSDGAAYFGERSVAAEYIGSPGGTNYADHMIRYDMHPDFLTEFADVARRYDWQGPGGAARIEWAIPDEVLLDRTKVGPTAPDLGAEVAVVILDEERTPARGSLLEIDRVIARRLRGDEP